MSKAGKQEAIDLILAEMEKGTIQRGKLLSKVGKKWQISTRTFDRYYKEAYSTYSARQQAIQKQLERESIEMAKERLKKAILTKEERMEIASDIAKGKAWKVENEVIAPSAGDRIKAMEYLSKIEGDFAAVKQDVTSKGESIAPIDNNKLEKLLSKLR